MKITIEAETQEELDAAIATLAGKTASSPKKTRVFYVSIGNMPAKRAKEYLAQVKKDFEEARTCESDYENFFIAKKGDESYIQVL